MGLYAYTQIYTNKYMHVNIYTVHWNLVCVRYWKMLVLAPFPTETVFKKGL